VSLWENESLSTWLTVQVTVEGVWFCHVSGMLKGSSSCAYASGLKNLPFLDGGDGGSVLHVNEVLMYSLGEIGMKRTF
jgi:hypothetical protein